MKRKAQEEVEEIQKLDFHDKYGHENSDFLWKKLEQLLQP